MFLKAIDTSFTFHVDENEVNKVDQTPNQPFNYNEHGYIRNEIATLYSMQNTDAYRVALAQLQEFEKSSDYDSNLSDSENLLRVVPAKMQDPVEIQRVLDYQEQLERSRLQSIIDEKSKTEEKLQTVEKSKTEVKSNTVEQSTKEVEPVTK